MHHQIKDKYYTMTKEQKDLVEEIQLLEKEIKDLNKKINESILEANELKVKVVNLREVLMDKYLLLKEVTEKIKINKEGMDS